MSSSDKACPRLGGSPAAAAGFRLTEQLGMPKVNERVHPTVSNLYLHKRAKPEHKFGLAMCEP